MRTGGDGMGKTFRTITRLLAVAAVICFIAGLILAGNKEKADAHDVGNIQITILDMRSECDPSQTGYGYNTYSVTFDVKIDNGTDAELNAIGMTFSFRDASGKTIGTMRTTFGNSYSDSFRLAAKQTIILETYLSAKENDQNDLEGLIGELYGAALQDYRIDCNITHVSYSDGYIVDL